MGSTLALIPRLQLVELEDLAWFPKTIRDLATDYLQFVEDRFGIHEPVVPILGEVLREAGTQRVVDLCSGGVGPWVGLERDLRAAGIPVEVTLTDKFPHLEAFRRAKRSTEGRLGYTKTSIDAMEVPPELDGVRTVFNAFHHFRPTDARRVLGNAVAANEAIAIFEIPDRTLFSVLSILICTPWAVVISTLFMRPFRLKRLLFTYLLPGVPLICVWDGVVSQLRAYTPRELRALGDEVDSERYEWKSGRVRVGRSPLHVTYLTGVPRKT